jgi:outer membrane protein assembly factor BamB
VKKYLGPIIFFVGAAVAVLAAWYVLHARPQPGAVIDTIPIDKNAEIVLREEAHSDRSFIELHMNGKLMWQALIPHYAGSKGRPAVAWSPTAVTVRVSRDGHAEVFAFAMRDAQKIGGYKLAIEHEPITTQPQGPITLTDQIRAYEVAGGSDWNQIAAIDLATGKGVWKRDLGAQPITDGGVDGSGVWLVQGGKRRLLDAATGFDK